MQNYRRYYWWSSTECFEWHVACGSLQGILWGEANEKWNIIQQEKQPSILSKQIQNPYRVSETKHLLMKSKNEHLQSTENYRQSVQVKDKLEMAKMTRNQIVVYKQFQWLVLLSKSHCNTLSAQAYKLDSSYIIVVKKNGMWFFINFLSHKLYIHCWNYANPKMYSKDIYKKTLIHVT